MTIIVCGFFYSRKHFKILRSSHYIERYNSSAMIVIKTVVNDFAFELNELDENAREERASSLIKSRKSEDLKLKSQLTLLLNLFTELAIAFEGGALDEKTTVKCFHVVIPKYVDRLLPYINECRKSEDVFSSLLKFSETLEKLEKKIN